MPTKKPRGFDCRVANFCETRPGKRSANDHLCNSKHCCWLPAWARFRLALPLAQFRGGCGCGQLRRRLAMPMESARVGSIPASPSPRGSRLPLASPNFRGGVVGGRLGRRLAVPRLSTRVGSIPASASEPCPTFRVASCILASMRRVRIELTTLGL